MTLLIAVAATFFVSVIGVTLLVLRAPVLDASAFQPKMTKQRARPPSLRA